MTDSLIIELHPSKTYLLLSSAIYVLCLFAIWHYLPQAWLNITLSGFLSLWFYYFSSKHILCNQATAVRKITFSKQHITLEKNNQSTQQYAWRAPTYQSPFLVTFELGKQSLVIFKDATQNQSLSSINRMCHAQR